ncbi:MAG: LUD domain-containing protein, partial [Fimbriimonadaceae bacterium]
MNRVESFARALDAGVTAAVRQASSIKTNSRLDALRQSFSDPEVARSAASDIKDYVLENFDELLAQFEANAKKNGIRVHQAGTPEEARSIIVSLCQAANGPIVKGKSMATEEIHLNSALIEAGHEVVETDLGEFVVQLDGDTPSHIVTPIIHRTRRDVARTFLKAEIGSGTEDPAELAMQARKFLRQKFKGAAVGISGVNFAIAETGRLVIIENEGNNRLSTT